ncbi:unnamed protein product [Parnassius apollo]|uniref:(apollo) hypothetical protein n=1 Tax=Parnassius apollo TaxID=110799 RepID=A0A8S3W2F2_PARAO|nr:unnamed protein product [Parnassius apollo]
MLLPQKRVLKGKEKRGYPTYKWSTKPPPPHRTPGKNIVPYLPGPVGVAKEVTTELDVFKLYFNKKIIDTILVHSNQEIAKQKANYGPQTSYTKDVDISELKAFFGLLYLTAVKKDNRVSTNFLWGISGSEIYSAIMSTERYKFLT